ncbi:NAD-dependent epimerase/dehydratase family protein [Latilactobacillus curvatus]|uniref:NAD-dependent epimerase/dehydratase family protein n=1 Tax=Latilactobacillus curvatus TaxID=28038 RepID=UPI0023D9AC05|nr:NAD(P)-dependent oxidoreductase [Latilactobacillus curvatus]
MKVLVTGANGYLGSGIVKELLNRGVTVVATDRTLDRVDSRAIKKPADLFNVDSPFEFFDAPDVLLHLAWRDGFVHNSDAHLEDLPKHVTFIKQILDGGLRRLAVMGSMHEVGFFEGSIHADTPCHPETMYGIAKNALREACELLVDSKSTKFQWLRGFYIVGTTKYGSSIFAKIVQAEEQGKTEFPFTSGKNQYDFLNYSEFCRSVALTVTQSTVNGIINISSGTPQKLSERVEQFITENNFNIRLQYGAYPDRPYDSKAIWGDNSKLRQIQAAAHE